MEHNFEQQLGAYLEKIIEIIDQDDPVLLASFIEEIHTQDIVVLIDELDEDHRVQLIKTMPWDRIGEVLQEVDSDLFNSLIRLFTNEQKTLILDNMSDDDITDIIGELSDHRRKEILQLLDKESADFVKELLVYEDDTAGGIMTKEFFALKNDMTIYDAIETIRETRAEAETIYYLYVTDEHDILKGVVSLRELIIAKPNRLIEEIVNENVIHVNVHDDQEEVARAVSKYNLLAIPVVNDERKLVGIITVDDVIDVIEEEATEDIMKFAGTSDEEYYEDDVFFSRILTSFKARMPWLVITIFGGLLSASIVDAHQGVLDTNTALALFMPILAGMGGNVGTQSSTLTVRNIAMGHIYGKEVWRTLTHEITVGLLVGLSCSILAGIAALVLKGQLILAFIVGVAMWVNIITAATIGTVVPLVFKKFGIDPAVASAPFITTTIDITGLTIYFTLATWMITKFI